MMALMNVSVVVVTKCSILDKVSKASMNIRHHHNMSVLSMVIVLDSEAKAPQMFLVFFHQDNGSQIVSLGI